MPEIDLVRKIAQQALKVSTSGGADDNWLWDRSQRVARNVEHICRLPEITGANLAIDMFCLVSAAYFSDSGFIHYADPEDMTARAALSDLNVSDLRDFSTQVVSDKLTGKFSVGKIEKINKIIIESSNKLPEMPEASILSDGRNLDDMGAVGIFNEFRRYAVHGKGAGDAIDNWQRKIDYRYWEARLKESFRFESVRKVADRRFHAAEYFMEQLRVENTAKDLEDVVLESLDKDTL